MFCKTDFFSFNQVWNTTDPDFSPCFHKTVLLWIPLGYLILLTPLRILLLHKSSSHYIIPWSWKTRIRLALAFVLGLLVSIDIGRSIYEHLNGGEVPTVDFLSPLSIVLAMVAFCVVVFYERKNSVQSSGFLFIFWALLLLVSIFNLRSQIRVASLEGKVEDMFSLVTFSLFFAVVVIQFILACVVVDSTPVGAIPIDDTNPCPEHHVSFISQITFWWFSRIVVQGYKRALVLKDLWSLNPEDKCRNVYPQFERYWNAELARCKRLHLTGKEEPREIELKEMGAKRQERIPEVAVAEAECKKSSPRLFWAIVKTFGPKSFVAAAFKVVFDMMQFTSPIILKYLIEYTANKDVQNWKGYFYATLMLVLALIQSVVLHQYFYHCTVIGMRMRTAMIAAVYQKMLKLSNAARKTSTVGEIVNLMSVDAQRLMDMMTYVNMIWSGPLQITISIYLLWVTLGPSILAGVAFMIIMIPLNGVIANKFKEFQVKQMSLKDKRIKMMNEILNGIKVLKLYAWEPSFEKKVLDIRNKELDILKKMSYLNAVTTFTWTVVPFLVSLITFAVYVMVDKNNILDADKAFVSLSLFNILRFPLSMVPQVVSSLVQVNVSVKRLRDFLGADELDLEAVQYDDEAKSAVKLENASFVWDKELMEKDKTGPTLTGINLDVSEGQLIAVVGTVGSGKSSLLSAILGEMDRLSGSVTVKGSTAYVAQQAWIQNATLMDNVLFGKPFELSSYRKVIDACALQSDLEIMPAGDQTEIGEKGINLSGGQKQRVSLARAVFQDADMYLMDDPLSAVDSHVGKHIFDNVLGPNGLLKGKTRVLVTHGVGFLSQVDTIVVLVNGKISEIGSYKQLLDHDGAFSQFLKNYLTEEMSKEDADIELDPEIMSQIESTVEGQTDAKLQKQLSMLSERMRTMSDTNTATPPGTPGAVRRIKSKESLMASRTSLHKAPNGVEKDLKGAREEEKKLIEAEKMETQRVKLSVFLVYLKSVGVLLGVSTILFYILTNAANIYSNIWLSEWSNDANNRTVINGTVIVDTAQRDMRLGVYGLLGVVQGLTIIVGALSLNLGNLKAGKNLHAAMLENIIASPMSFYDTTPLGRILNRFASDIDTLDRRIPEILTSWIQVVLKVLSVPIVVGSITPLFLAAAVPLGLSYFIAQRFYVATSRQLKRLESVSRSPIYSHFGETVMGVTTVRAYRQQTRFIETSEHKVDENLICHYPSIISNRWLAIRLELVGNCILFFAALFAVIARNDLSPGIVGLSITYALNITQTLNWMVRMTTELETNIVAVERVKEYSDTPTEADWEVKDKKPKADWPDAGIVEFEHYGTRYRPGLDLVVKDLNCKIQSGEKVGIVGRTGAGKSSLTLALFRIIEPAEGKIKIDGLDIKLMGLHDLRSKLTIIPQEPVLFSGPLRMNLDPFDEHSDEALWQALEHAHLKSFVSELPAKLEHECTEGGENLSVGQRQLVCLARALLRKTKILVLDEATAAVDLETDDLIQHTIRVEFKDATVLTIAHRLNTIMDYNRVMVLDQGNLREFDSPPALLQNEDSIFYNMAKDAGLA